MSSSSAHSSIAQPSTLLSATSPRSAELVRRDWDTNGKNQKNQDGRGPIFSIKRFRRPKLVREQLYPLESESPRVSRPLHHQRQLSIAPTSSLVYATSPHSPLTLKTDRVFDERDVEVLQLQRWNAQLASDETVAEWIRSYELERETFASFAVFTEVKLDEIQETCVNQMERPNAVEAAACCATLLKMPGIVGCYKTLLEKLATGIQSAIYVPATAPLATKSYATPLDSMPALVQHFYSQTPYFERVRELEKTLGASRDLTDPDVLRTMSIDDIARIFQYASAPHVQAGLAQAYATDATMLNQLIRSLQDQQGLLLQNRQEDKMNAEDPDYPVHVPLATSAQICRAISQHAATFSPSGKNMILCAIVDVLDTDSFRDVYQSFDLHGKMGFLHHLSMTESRSELELVVAALPQAGESLFRLYCASCLSQVGGMLDSNEQSPKDVFFAKLLSPAMEISFLHDLATYITNAQLQLLTKEWEKHEEEREGRRKSQRGMKKVDSENLEIELETKTKTKLPAVAQPPPLVSIDRFQLDMLNYIRQHNLSSAQLLKLVANTFLSNLEEREFSQLIDKCWTRFSRDGRWAKTLAIIRSLGMDEADTSLPEVLDSVAAIRLKMLKKLFNMLTQEERAAWMDQHNEKYPTVKYRKTMQDVKYAAAATVVNKSMDLSDPAVHLKRMESDLKMRWVHALIESLLSGAEDPARLAALQQLFLPFVTENPAASGPPLQEESLSCLSLAEEAFQQLNGSEKATFLAKFFVPPVPENGDTSADVSERTITPLPVEKAVVDVVDRASSPVHELELEPAPAKETTSLDSQIVATALLDNKSDDGVVELLPEAAAPVTKSDVNSVEPTSTISNDEKDKDESVSPARLSRSLKRKLTAVNAVAEPMEWQDNVKIGSFNVACQTDFDIDDEPFDIAGQNEFGRPQSTSRRSRVSKPMRKGTPLTLTSLLGKHSTGSGGGGGKNKKERYQRISHLAVPRSVSGLITSWRMNPDQLAQFAKKSLANVLKIIADAYSEMLTATRRKAQQQSTSSPLRGKTRKLTLSQIVYQSFLHSYGLPSIADMHLLALSCAVETYRTQHLRVEYFAKFCFEEVPRAQLTKYFEFLECIVSENLADTTIASRGSGSIGPPLSAGGNSSSHLRSGMSRSSSPAATKRSRFGGPRFSVPDKENWMISVDRAHEITHLCFRDMRKTAVAAFCDNLATIAAQGMSTAVLPPAVPMQDSSGGGEHHGINVDYLLELVLAEWQMEQHRRERHLLDAFRAGDVNGDGHLTSAEFTQIVRSIDATRELGDILLMYSETVRRTESEQLNPDVFLQVARDYELDRAVWQNDGDLFGVVNEVQDMEATWTHVRGFFIGTLEALARDLPLTHSLRVCQGAGCGCLKCLLDGYVGFQEMRWDFAHEKAKEANPMTQPTGGVSSQLLWTRFWSLMRQLHNAAAESDGIVTPWEGIQYSREQPALALAPRSTTRRRDALPNLLLPDTARITGKMSPRHDPEVFDAHSIHAQFTYLLSHLALKKPTDTSLH